MHPWRANKPGFHKGKELLRGLSTEYGIHILKLIRRIPPPANGDATARHDLKQKISEAGLLENAREDYVRRMMPGMKYKPANVPLKKLQMFTDSILVNANTKASGLSDGALLFSLGNEKFTVSDWVAYARVQQMGGTLTAGKNIKTAYDEFVFNKASDYLPLHLDELDKEFALQFKEFKDANLLFSSMEQNVWNKASEDTIGLRNYYEKNKEKYVWGENLTGVMVSGSDSLLLVEARLKLQKDIGAWKTFGETYQGKLYADSGRFELGAYAEGNRAEYKIGNCTSVKSNGVETSLSFACIVEMGKTGTQRGFEDARGYIVSDYQKVLEDNWIKELKRKYPVKMNEAEWKKLLDTEGK